MEGRVGSRISMDRVRGGGRVKGRIKLLVKKSERVYESEYSIT